MAQNIVIPYYLGSVTPFRVKLIILKNKLIRIKNVLIRK